MTAVVSSTGLTLLPVDALFPGLDFRLDEDTDALRDLAASIAEHGVLQPLIVRAVDGGWEVAAGRRRLAAARMAGLAEVPCIERALTDDEAADIALTENLHRRELSAVEEALAYARLRDRGLSQNAIARHAGRSQAHVSRLLRVLELPAAVRRKIHDRQMSYATALDRWGRKRYRDTGEHASGSRKRAGLSGDDAALVSYWRRRHDRVLGGLYAMQKARPLDERSAVETTSLWMRMVDRLIKLDAEPFVDKTGEGAGS